MSHATTKNHLIENAPRHTVLRGDKTLKTEAATHIIEFPGGAIELTRTSDGNYWAHVIVNRDFAMPGDVEGLEGAYGEIASCRMDYAFPISPNIVEVPDAQHLRHIAILIKPRSTKC